MAKKVLMKGNEVIAEAALRAGCKCYFGYPITPQTEITQYMSAKLPERGGVFIQAESEVAAINMVYGASATGKRVMTSSSSPGISLKSEGISYLAGSELPAVVVNIMRSGPGLGGILPGQGDYFQAVKGGGHGDYKNIVLAPNSTQEMYELTVDAFNMADKYRMVAMILGDGAIGQMMEPVEFREVEEIIPVTKDWATTGTKMEREQNVISSVYIDPNVLEQHNRKLQAKYALIEKTEQRAELYNCENAKVIIVAYGCVSRIAKSVIKMGKKDGIEIGLLRPITLWPFPNKFFEKVIEIPEAFLCVEMSEGQMIEDVKLATKFKKPVHFYGRSGGNIPTANEIYGKIKQILEKGERD